MLILNRGAKSNSNNKRITIKTRNKGIKHQQISASKLCPVLKSTVENHSWKRKSALLEKAPGKTAGIA